jgi:beta-lactamase class A
VILLAEAGNPATTVAHLGTGFPVSPTSAVADVLGDTWLEVAWRTPGRSGTAWLPESSLAFQAPGGAANASVDALDPDLSSYLAALGVRAGVEVYDVTRSTVYTYNATHQYTTASSVKVPIMLAFLAQVEAAGREPTAQEKTLLTEMIEKSMDYAATTLWGKIGGAAGLSAYMKRIGVEGLSPYTGGWSWSTMSPHAMVGLLTKLHEGTILNPEHRELALYLMEHVITSQRIGVADTAPAGARVAMKIGRWWYDERHGGTVMSSSGIVTLGAQTYIISVYTDHNPSMPQAEATVRHVCGTIAGLLLSDAA